MFIFFRSLLHVENLKNLTDPLDFLNFRYEGGPGQNLFYYFRNRHQILHRYRLAEFIFSRNKQISQNHHPDHQIQMYSRTWKMLDFLKFSGSEQNLVTIDDFMMFIIDFGMSSPPFAIGKCMFPLCSLRVIDIPTIQNVRFFKYFDMKELETKNQTFFFETAIKFHIKNIRVILRSEQLFF